MKYALSFHPESLRDLDSLFEGVYEASKSIEIATRYLNDLLDELNKKAYFPYSTPTFDFCGLMLDIHHFTFKAYKVFFIFIMLNKSSEPIFFKAKALA